MRSESVSARNSLNSKSRSRKVSNLSLLELRSLSKTKCPCEPPKIQLLMTCAGTRALSRLCRCLSGTQNRFIRQKRLPPRIRPLLSGQQLNAKANVIWRRASSFLLLLTKLKHLMLLSTKLKHPNTTTRSCPKASHLM